METLIVVLVVALAVIVMARRFMKKLKPGASCGCDGCACGIQDKINVQDSRIVRN